MRRVFVDNVEVPLEMITYNNGLNFSRFLEDTVVKPYRFYLSKEDFIEVIEPPYIVARDEIKLDDETYNETSDFKESGYCTFLELLEKPKYLYEIFDWYLRHYLFFTYVKNDSAKYVINSIDTVTVGDQVEITGRAFVKKQFISSQ
ncbi:MAG: hypothetical protein CMB99_09980 [Flavobacteriaceae bacterium]|nr:hypothetical protein [Flavobacteriaceae bacterium]|tara:strand:- start:342560 stop:342997 length:438 start_codon:yes stop_codon:yes gene_type:complete